MLLTDRHPVDVTGYHLPSFTQPTTSDLLLPCSPVRSLKPPKKQKNQTVSTCLPREDNRISEDLKVFYITSDLEVTIEMIYQKH